MLAGLDFFWIGRSHRQIHHHLPMACIRHPLRSFREDAIFEQSRFFINTLVMTKIAELEGFEIYIIFSVLTFASDVWDSLMAGTLHAFLRGQKW